MNLGGAGPAFLRQPDQGINDREVPLLQMQRSVLGERLVEMLPDAAKRLPPKYQNAFRFELRSWAELRASI